MSDREAFLAQLQTARHALVAAADLAPAANLPTEHVGAASEALAIVDAAIAELTRHIFSDGTTRPITVSPPLRLVARSGPRVEERPETRYLAIPAVVARTDLPVVVPALLVELYAWLETHGGAAAGPPLVRYRVVDTASRLEVDVGVPVTDPIKGDGRVIAGVLPAGDYAVLTHTGTYETLVDSNAALQTWAMQKGLHFDTNPVGRGVEWRGRLESYAIGPETEPDPALWETEIAYLLARGP